MAKHTQTIRRQFTDELFECVWPFFFFNLALKGLKKQTFYSVYAMDEQPSHHTETSRLKCNVGQVTGFYKMGTLIVNGLAIIISCKQCHSN